MSLNVCIKSCLTTKRQMKKFFTQIFMARKKISLFKKRMILKDLNREKSLNGNSVKGLLFRYLNSFFLEPGSNFTQYYLVQHGTLYTVSDTICLFPEFHLPLRLFYNYDIRKLVQSMFWFLINRRNLTKFLW